MILGNLLNIANYIFQKIPKPNLDITFEEMNTGHNLTQEDLDLSVAWFKKNF